MPVFVPKEIESGETRVALVPEAVKRLVGLGAEVWIEAGLGASISISDRAYQEAGGQIAPDRQSALGSSDVILRVRKPPENEVSTLKSGCIHVSLLDAFHERDLVRALAAAGVTAIGLEMLPRITIAQKMDVLSSQASLAGYAAVIAAAGTIDRIFPMMMTPAGTLKPVRLFVIGVGVAGLQVIATARRLGARVEAFDTRPAVEEQVQSLGAKFVKVDLGETGQTAQGYARELTPEQLEKQREVMAQHCAKADIVITTAQVFGRKAPLIVTNPMVDQMQPGSVIVDMAVESGGNVECSLPDETVERNGVRVLGLRNLPGRVARHASEMYSNNLGSLLEHFWDKESKIFRIDLSDEILKHCVLTHDGKIVNETIEKLYSA
ncbi:MAG: Re/Si-specific NAD(P)(+) transhydrogenase subunit alpha [Verrucomicrobiota bacterium]|nr:Re/Si-specific NAD(P)(+) transhydrogenase subunit alpha [Chthoniobacterales bacterium]MDQ3414227.1 Re/Si-specific NAD(P)(+) transhydrogenase subunit alpha [Verrucomicrobiota bacterium]